MRIGDHQLSKSKAERLLHTYAQRHRATLLYYDLDGDPTRDISASDGVGIDDIGRMCLINARLTGDNAAWLLDKGNEISWDRISHQDRLEAADPNSDLYACMLEMWRAIECTGVKKAKISKLLHLKRPLLFPILDNKVCKAYKRRHQAGVDFWPLMRDDLCRERNELREVRDRFVASAEPDVWLTRLPELRILDILAWMLGSST